MGLAAYYAYRAYNDSSALQLAMSNWELAYLNYVTGPDEQAGPPSNETNFPTSCACKSHPLAKVMTSLINNSSEVGRRSICRKLLQNPTSSRVLTRFL